MNDTAPGRNFQSPDDGGTRTDVPTRKSSALKSDRETRAAGTMCDNRSSSAHTKYKIPSVARRTCDHLWISD